MQQVLSTWTGLDLRRQIVLIVATMAVFVGVLAMGRLATAPTLTLLYSGLESSAAGDVVTALEQRGAAYEVRGGSIFVDSKLRDELRLTLASEGLPANGNKGYELLDSLSGFGTTSQMFDAAYWRAKEGELARTIVSSPNVSAARVHIATGSTSPFQRGTTPKASVQITAKGGNLSSQHAKAIRFLIASAVANLEPDDVAVIDSNGMLISSLDDQASTSSDDNSLEIKQRVERLLEARVGMGNAVVEVSVEKVNETEELRERRFDPEGRVAISTDTEERSTNSNEAGGGEVTIASNLPDNEGGAGGSASSQNSETRERVNYEVSETERAILREAGAIKRLTVAVLVNDLTSVNEDGATVTSPRPDEELESLRELVASAVGFSEERGDVITIKSMTLLSVPPVGTDASGSTFDWSQLDIMSVVQMIILAVVTIVLGLFVIRPLLARSSPSLSEVQANDSSQFENTNELLAIEQTGDPDEAGINIDSSADFTDLPGLPDFGIAGSMSDDPFDRLRSVVGERQEESVQILRSWLEEKKEEKV